MLEFYRDAIFKLTTFCNYFNQCFRKYSSLLWPNNCSKPHKGISATDACIPYGLWLEFICIFVIRILHFGHQMIEIASEIKQMHERGSRFHLPFQFCNCIASLMANWHFSSMFKRKCIPFSWLFAVSTIRHTHLTNQREFWVFPILHGI